MQTNLLSGGAQSCGCTNATADDLTGRKFDRLRVLGPAPFTISPKGKKIYRWRCLCACGNTTVVRSSHLIDREVRSCGCLAEEINTSRWTPARDAYLRKFFYISGVEDVARYLNLSMDDVMRRAMIDLEFKNAPPWHDKEDKRLLDGIEALLQGQKTMHAVLETLPGRTWLAAYRRLQEIGVDGLVASIGYMNLADAAQRIGVNAYPTLNVFVQKHNVPTAALPALNEDTYGSTLVHFPTLKEKYVEVQNRISLAEAQEKLGVSRQRMREVVRMTGLSLRPRQRMLHEDFEKLKSNL